MPLLRRRPAACLLALSAAACALPAAAGDTLDAVRQRGQLRCGVNVSVPGFSSPDSQGRWTGLDVDICRAVAAAVLGNADKVEFVPLNAQQRFAALQSGEIDMLSRNTTWTLSRDAGLKLAFGPVVFYDGQGFMVANTLGVRSATELDGASVCVQSGTSTEQSVADWFRAHRMTFKPVVMDNFDELNKAFFAHRCDVYTTDRSGLASIRATLSGSPDNYAILPETISKEPLAPAVRQNDPEWADAVFWSVTALIEAEELGVTAANVDTLRESGDPALARFLGKTPDLGTALGLREDWAYQAIRQVGNYGEIYARNLEGPLGLARGPNALWTQGGLLYAIPVR